jgi:hypothetical protein
LVPQTTASLAGVNKLLLKKLAHGNPSVDASAKNSRNRSG